MSAPDTKFTPGPWREMVDQPPHDQRPIRQWIAVEGIREHHGSTWRRFYVGEAITRPDGLDDEQQGYRRKDIEAIEDAGDMDRGTGLVIAWMPVSFPSVPWTSRESR